MTPSAAVDSATRPVSKAPEDFILVVDDEPTNLSLLKNTLSSTGLKIRVVTSGLKALELTQKYLPNLILLDIAMPDMDGFETCQRLKADPVTAAVPIIFATAFSEVEQKLKGFALGAVDYITKPFHVEEVLARVKLQLEMQSLTTTLSSRNQRLEQEVQARQLAEENLSKTNQQLHHSLQELKNTQTQLIQAEKMLSLGQMVAGIAHEINNPVGFIQGNIEHAEAYFQDLLNLINTYEVQAKKADINLNHQTTEIDLEFLQQDFSKLITSMARGCDRIKQIVLGLQNFSRLDEAGKKFVDLTEGIENTLMIVQHSFKLPGNRPNISVAKHYGNIPLIFCYANQLNQVFLQILTNAVDALSMSGGITAPEIKITTEMKDEQTVRICIADNGPGMTEAVQNRIFDPFFTTKTVGKGTGLGLAIGYQIITEQHGGHICCTSELGQGTEFAIELPVS